MRVAALYDIHGNLPALEAVLDEVERCDVDLIVVGGDVVPGPMPRQVLDVLFAMKAPTQFIRGNCEAAVLDHVAHTTSRALPKSAIEATAWTAEQLEPDDLRAFGSWPKTMRVRVDGIGDVLFCHATPRDEDEIFTRRTPEPLLVPLFCGHGASAVVCGHTHMQFDRMIGGVRVINAGSVGMPFGTPGADWLLLDGSVHLRHTAYDLAAAADRVRQTKYPQAEAFAQGSVLTPPTEEAMFEVFATADAKLADRPGWRE
jgi:putative phosphoesterase